MSDIDSETLKDKEGYIHINIPMEQDIRTINLSFLSPGHYMINGMPWLLLPVARKLEEVEK